MKDMEMILQEARMEGCEEACRITPVLLQARAGKITMTDAYNQLITEGFPRETIGDINESLTKCLRRKVCGSVSVQQTLSEIIPQLVELYDGHVFQIVRLTGDSSRINLAVLFDSSYTLEMHQVNIGKSRKLIRSMNAKYGASIINVINCRYSDIQDPTNNSPHIYNARNGKIIWSRGEMEGENE